LIILGFVFSITKHQVVYGVANLLCIN